MTNVVSISTATYWPSAKDYNLRAASLMAKHVVDHFGADRFQQLIAPLGLEPHHFALDNHWVSIEQMDAFLVAVHRLLGSDERFMEAAAYRMAEDGFGALRWLLWATSPSEVLKQSARHVDAIIAHGRYEVVESSATSLVMRYRTTRPEGRLFCLARRAQGAALPTAWGLPAAHLSERRCLNDGDPYCEYDLRCFARTPGWAHVLVLLLGLAVSLAAHVMVGIGWVGWVGIPSFVFALGLAISERRTNRTNLAVSARVQSAMSETTLALGAAHRELQLFQERQDAWGRFLEQQLGSPASAIEEVVERLGEGGMLAVAEREAGLEQAVAGLQSTLAGLRQTLAQGRNDALETRRIVTQLEAHATAVDALETMARGRTLRADLPLLPVRPSQLDTDTLTESIRARLGALCFARSLRSAVLRTRDAPRHLHVDVFILDRLIDSLLAHVVRHLSRGSVLVEIDGTPAAMVLKISDTRPSGHLPDSDGTQPDCVAFAKRLAALLSGSVEVLATPDGDQTYWLYLPREAPDVTPSSSAEPGDSVSNTFLRWVKDS